ncbi:MAG: secretin N-terminal domain-containing protein [Akkermansiaceae bacterium]
MKLSLLLVLGLGSMALAQEPTPLPVEPTPLPVEPTAPGLPGTLPTEEPADPRVPLPGRAARAKAAFDPNAIAVTANDAITLPVMTGIEAADLYRKHTGKRVLLSSEASQAEAYFVQQGPMTHAEVVELLELVLLNEGITVVPDPLRPHIVRMVAGQPKGNETGIPKAYIDDPLGLPLTDQIVTYKMQFDNLKPEEALKVFQQVMGAGAANGRGIVAVTNASSLIITENSALIRQLIKLKEGIDLPVKVTEEWIKVVYADVDEIAEQLNEIYNERGSSSNTTSRTTRARTPLPANASAAVAPGGASGEDIPPRIIPDARTNRLLVTGKPADIVVIKSLIQGFDQPSDEGNDFSYRLRYVRVNEFLQISYDAIEATLSQGTGASGAGGNRLGNQTQNSRTNNRTSTNRSNNTGVGGSSNGGGGSRTSLQQEDIPTAPEALIVNKTLLVADNNSNSIIVNGPPHHIQIVKNLIDKLDSPGQQVVISAVIGSYSLGNNLNFGLDLARTITKANGDSGLVRFNPGGASSGIITGEQLSNLGQLLTASGTAGNGLSLYGTNGDNFSAFVNALETNTNFKSLNRPVVTTRNNRVARISSGRRIAIPASTSSFSGQQNTNVEYRDVTLELEVQPLINSDTEVTLNIAIVRDRLTDESTAVSTGVDVPTIATEELTTNVVAESGSCIILGGLITEDSSKTRDGLPIISRIPGLGKLLGNSSDGKSRSELVILLRPQIINTRYDYRNFADGFEQDSSFTGEIKESLPPIGGTLLPSKKDFDGEAQSNSKKKSWWGRGSGSSASSSSTKDRPGRSGKNGSKFNKFGR